DENLINDMLTQLEDGMAYDYEYKPRLLFLKGKGEDVCIKLKDLAWIQADGSYVRFHYVNGTSKIMSGNLHSVMLQLYAGGIDYIVRIHNSHAVNLYHITGRSGNVIFIAKTSLSVSNKYKKAFSKHYIVINKSVQTVELQTKSR
ncbi:MAG: LytTR family transcriptional regulator DNA-binding domain-containing protein, partial [Prevotella sp.]